MSQISGSAAMADTRRKQSRKDEAIRNKIASELSRKRTISTTQPMNNRKRGGKAVKGTVAALRPSPALTVPESMTVSDASQLCAAKRTDCVLVVDDEEGLSGIFTAKDLAYRVAAEGLDPRNTPVSAIMTRGPMVTRDTTGATEALQLMVQRHFRHLPVCNDEGNVVGLLDITKVFHEALDKVERSSSASLKLYTALEGVQSELGNGLPHNPQAAAMLAYVESLREKTALPDLTTIMDSRTNPATVSPRTTVRDAAKLMKEFRTTAVCVMEKTGPDEKIVGIFTSKDVVLRVIAAGLDPGRCSVVRVMTPHPDTAPPTMTIQDALKKMYNGHYLNLPVVEYDGRLVAIVDVLKLTYATLEHMNSMGGEDGVGQEENAGPVWGRFFDSIGHDNDNDSVLSGSHAPHEVEIPPPMHGNQSFSEIHPDDSASAIDDDHASLHGARFAGASIGAVSTVESKMAPVPVDDGTYVFKFSTPSGRTHRFQARNDHYENLREIITGKLTIDPFITAHKDDESKEHPDPNDYHLAYVDSDGDTVYITQDSDVQDAVKLARAKGVDRVVLFVHGGRGWELANVPPPPLPEPVVEKKEVEIAPPPPPPPVVEEEKILGVLAKEHVLPASIAFLGVVIVTVFAISRFTSD
ncbi:CBS-domain-containing protein [Auriculariales sp. MPI-PUGE-AT-0066]|nr:CBS-domain-containing protein [Auriculariales sp. MPI-PUGE-AT-0066]